MNKLLRVSVAVVLLLGMAGGFAGCGLKSYEGFRYSPRDEGVVIRSYKEQSGRTVLEIPDEIEGRPVVRVENFGAFNTSSVKTIVIGKNCARNRRGGRLPTTPGLPNSAWMKKMRSFPPWTACCSVRI